MIQQLTYGCSDGIPGRASGGWGVLHRAGSLDPEVERAMISMVSVDMPFTLPDFPSRAEKAARQPRLRGARDADSGHFLLARSVEAGLDHTLRPGNVFTHVARVPRGAGVRPLDWAESPGWRSPHGAGEVRVAQPADDLPLPEPSGFAGVVPRVRDDAAIPWVVDSLMHLLDAGRPVCLIEPEVARVTAWLSLVMWLLDERAAAQLSFGLNEDRRSVAQAVEGGFRVVSVPTMEAAETIGQRAVVLDASWRPDDTQAALTGRWALPSGLTVPRTDWPRLAVDLVWSDPTRAAAALEQRDALAAGLRRLQSLPEGNAAQLAVLQLGLATQGAPTREGVESALAALPPLALTNPVVKRLVAEVGLGQAAPPEPTANPSVSFAGRPAPQVSSAPQTGTHRMQATPPAAPAGPAPTAGPGLLEWPEADRAVRAALALDRELAAALLSGSALAWYEAYRSAAAKWRPLLCAVAAHVVEPLPAEVTAAVMAAPTDGDFEALAASLLVLLCRSQWAHPPLLAPQGATWSALGALVVRSGPDDLAPLARQLAAGGVPHDPAQQPLAALTPIPGSVWTWPTRTGQTLLDVLRDDPAGAVPDAVWASTDQGGRARRLATTEEMTWH